MSQCSHFDHPLLRLADSSLQVSPHFVFLTDLLRGVTTMTIGSKPSFNAMRRGIQKDRVFLAPVGAHATMSFPSYMARATFIWNQQGRFPVTSSVCS